MSGLRRDTVAATGLQGLRLASSLAVFVMFRVQIGIPAYGVYSALLGLVLLVVLLSSSWIGPLILQMHFRDGLGRREILARVLLFCVGIVTVGLVAVVVLQGVILPDESLRIILLLFAAEVIAQLFFEATAAFVQVNSFVRATMVRAIPVVVRSGVAGTLLFVDGARLVDFAVALAGALAVAAVATVVVLGVTGRPLWATGWPARTDLRDGFTYAGTSGLYAIQDDIDKVMLLRYRPDAEAGAYAAAYRLYQMVLYPVSALVAASHTTMLRAGRDAEVLARARRFALLALGYCSLTAVVGFGLAEPLAALFGTEVAMVRLLAFVGLTKCTVDFWLNGLIGLGHNARRMYLVGATAAVNVVGNLLLIPHYGWAAAAATSLFADTLISIIGYYVFTRAVRNRSVEESDASLVEASAEPRP